MSAPLLVYGATGYTGRLVTEACVARGLRPVLCARNRQRLEPLAERLGLAHRVAGLGQRELDAALDDVAVVLNAAGPFSTTAHLLADASLRRGVHYLDISGELDAIELIRARHAEAVRRNVMLMPATGFDVVPSDCLARHVSRRLPGARRIAIAVRGLDVMSRGSARTLIEQFGKPVRVRRRGRIVEIAKPQRGSFDFGNGATLCITVTWGDVATAYCTTGIPDTTVYFEATPAVLGVVAASHRLGGLWRLSALPIAADVLANLLPDGPTPEARRSRGATIVAVAEDEAGNRTASRLHTPEAYSATAHTASTIAQRVVDGDFEPGFQTPGRLFGADFVLALPGVWREDVDA